MGVGRERSDLWVLQGVPTAVGKSYATLCGNTASKPESDPSFNESHKMLSLKGMAMKPRISAALFAALFSALSYSTAFAQVQTGPARAGAPASNPTVIVGTVQDSSSRPLAGAA